MNLKIDGYNINYKITGAGENTVIILQGWGTKLEVYDFVAGCICERYKVVQLDLPGFGESDEPREAWNVDAYVDFFIKFAERLGIRKMTLIGHSYGGRIIIKLVNREELPFSVERIVLVDSAGIVPKKSLRQKISIKKYRLLKRIFQNRLMHSLFPELIDSWKNRQGSEDYRNATPIMRQCLVMAVNEDLTGILQNVRQDTLLIWGELDTATPLSDGKLMEEKIPLSGLAVIRGAGHYCFLDQPVIFQNIMRSYFNIGDWSKESKG